MSTSERKVRCMNAKTGSKHSPLVLLDKLYELRRYRCPDCGTLQEAIAGNDGIERWSFTNYKWNIARANRLGART